MRNCFRRLTRPALLFLLAIPIATGSDIPDFSGIWVEPYPDSGPPLVLFLTQAGPRLQVRMGYGDRLSGRAVGVADIENGNAILRSRQTCVARFQKPGYKYDNPGVNTLTLSLRQPTDPAESGPQLVYVMETRWDVPCSNHPIGTERTMSVLKRRDP